jgi:tetratricopeptide (TPR) repeat protein
VARNNRINIFNRMSDSASKEKEAVATEGGSRWARCAVLGAVCALVIGFYAWSASSGVLELMGSGAQDSYYNLQVQGFRDGHLSVKREAPPNLGDPAKLKWQQNYGLDDLSYYKGKLYLYFGVTPALLLFWPYVALTGHYLTHKDAAVIFFSAAFLAGAGLLWAVWRRYFKESGVGVLAAGTLALGLGNFAPAILGRCDVYEVAVGCGYALTMLALWGVWCALHDERRRWRWLAGASLAYGLAVGARPSLLLGAVILLAPVYQAWREKGRVWPLLMAAFGPIVAIGVGLMFYNALRFDNPLEFGQRYQLPFTVHQQFRLRYLWFNFRVGFLEPARWSGHSPFVDNIVAPALPAGYGNLDEAYGVLTNLPLVWLALAVPLAWRNRPEEARSKLRRFFGAVALLFGMFALPLVLHDSMCMRYEMEYVSPLLLLAVVGVFGLERALAGQAVWRRAARCGWGLLLAFTVAFNLFASYKSNADNHQNFGVALLETGRVDEAITQYEMALQMRHDSALVRNNLGNALVRKGRLDEAITQYQKTLQTDPDYALAHNNLGNTLQQTGKLDEAIPQYQQALQLKPDYAEAHYNLGNALLQKDRVDEAIPQFQQALQLIPDYTEARINLGNALLQKGRVDEAIPQYQQALQLKPGHTEAHFNLGVALVQKGRVDEAIAQYQQALQLKPDYTEAHYNLGVALLQKGSVDEAITQFQQALQINPAYAEACGSLGYALLQKGGVDEAIVLLQKALEIKPDYTDARINLGNAFLQKDKVDQAIPQYQQALQINPADPAIQNKLAWLLATAPQASLRNGVKAVELARQANLLTGGENPVILHTLAAACAEAGRFSEAVETAQHALRLAESQTNTALAGTLQEELKLYQAGSPLRGPEQPH